ncbi:MAG: class I SAM-dependent methyltransferase [Candidatus Gottesmanbacteria bacterium]|nr:class I SAM-dependent methyltransferase [Candidatus Gottesmanbacteria bacterium]
MQSYLYDDLYELEDSHWWHRAKRRLVLTLIRRFAPRTHPRILDVGCGTGKNIEEWSRLGTTTGIDIEPRAIAYCRRRGITHVRRARAEHTGLPASSVDIVTLLDVLEHTEDTTVLSELARILSKRGILIVTVPAYPWLWSTWDTVLHHKRRYTKTTLRRALTASGFNPLYISHVFSFLPIPVMLVRLIKSGLPKDRYGSDFRITAPAINRILYALCVLEQYVMKIVPLPFGTSIVCAAQKI